MLKQRPFGRATWPFLQIEELIHTLGRNVGALQPRTIMLEWRGRMRYYFHLRESEGYVQDDEGRELEAPEAVREAALADARSIIAGDALLGRLPLRTIIEVEDENGNRVIELPFKDAVYIDG